MKAAVYDQLGGPEVIRYAEVADPVARKGGLLMEVKAIGLQGGDLINRREGEMVGSPHHQVSSSQAMAPTRQARMTALVTTERSIIPLPIVLATAVPRVL